jgi:hypothetical protein
MDEEEIKLALRTLAKLERLHKCAEADNDAFLLRKVDRLSREFYDIIEACKYNSPRACRSLRTVGALP